MKVLLDSNTLFSGLGFMGMENKVIWLAILGRIRLVVSDYIVAEFRRTVEKKFTGDRKKKAVELLNRLLVSGAVEVKGREDYISYFEEADKLINEKDSPILACAMREDIDVLVSGDKDFHTSKVKGRVRVMKAREFLEWHHRMTSDNSP